jgi:hypothetical protein
MTSGFPGPQAVDLVGGEVVAERLAGGDRFHERFEAGGDDVDVDSVGLEGCA